MVRVDDSQQAVWQEFGVRSQPAWAFINDDGTVEMVRGSLGHDGLNAEIEALIAR